MSAESPLDALYRPRTTTGLQDTIPGEHRLEQAGDESLVRVDVYWPHKQESHLRIDCTSTTVNFLRLDSHRPGLYGDLCDKLPRFFKLRGVTEFRMCPQDGESRDVLLKRGSWEPVPGGYRWVL